MDVDRPIVTMPTGFAVLLQWSHVLMDVDRIFGASPSSHAATASMEPRPDGRG